MPAVLIQKKVSAEANDATTFTVTFDLGVAPGHHIVVNTASWNNSADPAQSITSIADNKGNGNYSNAVTPARISSEVLGCQYYANNIATGGTGFQVTVTWGGGTGVNGCVGVLEYSGIKVSPTVTTTSNTSTGTDVTTGDVAPTALSAYVAGMAYNGAAATVAIAGGSDFTEQQEMDENNDQQDCFVADLVNTSGTKGCEWTISASRIWLAWIAAYELAAVPTEALTIPHMAPQVREASC